MQEKVVRFSSLDRLEWIRTISITIGFDWIGLKVFIDVSSEIDINQFTPLHLSTLACFIGKLRVRGNKVSMYSNSVTQYIYNELHFKEYFIDEKGYVPARDETILNLWRIEENKKEEYARLVQEYLRTIYPQKDLTVISSSLTESYYNVYDHADAKGIAFSMIRYNRDWDRLSIAVCDFGVGIPNHVRRFDASVGDDDCQAIKRAMEYSFTSKSTNHNGGFGLGNIRSSCMENDYLRIISGKGLIVADKDTIKPYQLDFSFPGTILYYDITLSKLEEEEITSFDL